MVNTLILHTICSLCWLPFSYLAITIRKASRVPRNARKTSAIYHCHQSCNNNSLPCRVCCTQSAQLTESHNIQVVITYVPWMWVQLTSQTSSGEHWVNFVGYVHTLKFHKQSFWVTDVDLVDDPVFITNWRELPTVPCNNSNCTLIFTLRCPILLSHAGTPVEDMGTIFLHWCMYLWVYETFLSERL